ncbi:hypothetical protein K7X08_011400 [Anisodus acutangulus]|uniref:Uncharacterized protein n=1 Tax=Anisodus acutangulus TaxID=402998 RepID=A0A9Q1MND6_9SOLA|nr:hypothetical protein K7X08_011400 [Anisodus acutangulus]
MKMKNVSLLLLTLALFFISVCSQNVEQIQFVLRWPQTYCNKDPKPKVKCDKTPPLKFTLDGFGGTDSNGKILQGCKDTEKRDWKKVLHTTMVTQLNNFWPSLTKQEPIDMWKEAWNTYGTCIIKTFKGPTQYFNRAVRLAGEIGDLLQHHLINSDGIVPCDSATYNNGEILNSFKKVSNNQELSFTCKKINSTHAYLDQVTFCYDQKDPRNIVSCLSSVTSQRCLVQNIIVPRPSPPTRAFISADSSMTGEKLRPNSIWEILRQLI